MAYTRSSALYEKLGGVNSYVLAIAKDANFSQDVRNFTTSEAEYKVELAGFEQEYYWKVQAIFLAKYNYGQTVKSALGHFVFTLGTGLSATDVRYYTPDVDGVRDAAYASSAKMVLGQEYQASPGSSAVPATDTTATGYLVWDENNLYVYVDVNKTGIFSNPLLDGGTSEYACLQDCVQIDLQTENSQLYSVIVHGDGDGYYCTLNGWTGDAKYAVMPKADGSGYTVEFAVPFGEGMQAGDEVEICFRETSADATRWANYLEQVAAGTATEQQAPVFRYGDTDLTTYTLSSQTWSEENKILHTSPVVDGKMDTAYLRSARTELGPMCYALMNDVEELETTGFLYMLWDDTNLYYYVDISTASINSNPLLDAYLAAGDLTKWRTFIRFEDCVQLSVKTEIGTAHVQFWFPVGALGVPTYANCQGALYWDDTVLRIQLTGSASVTITVTDGDTEIYSAACTLKVGQVAEFPAGCAGVGSRVKVMAGERQLLDYTVQKKSLYNLPECTQDMPNFKTEGSAQELYLEGIHVQQYRDPAVEPDVYWEEALLRDPCHIPSIMSLADYRYRQCRFDEASALAERAITAMTRYNKRPESGRIYQLLGLIRLAQHRAEEAYDLFWKASWNMDTYSAAMVQIAAMEGQRRDYGAMAEHSAEALRYNADHPLGGVFHVLALWQFGRTKEAQREISLIIQKDPLHHLARYAAVLCGVIRMNFTLRCKVIQPRPRWMCILI